MPEPKRKLADIVYKGRPPRTIQETEQLLTSLRRLDDFQRRSRKEVIKDMLADRFRDAVLREYYTEKGKYTGFEEGPGIGKIERMK